VESGSIILVACKTDDQVSCKVAVQRGQFIHNTSNATALAGYSADDDMYKIYLLKFVSK